MAHNNVTQMSLGEACVAVIRCLGHERDWRVLKLVLERIPRVISCLTLTEMIQLTISSSHFYIPSLGFEQQSFGPLSTQHGYRLRWEGFVLAYKVHLHN